MALFAQNTNQRQPRVSVSTRYFTSYSDTCMLIVGGWNRNLSLNICPATGKDANGLTQYTQDNGQSLLTSITPENAIALSKAVDKYVYPAIEEKRPSEKVTIMIGGNSRNGQSSQKKEITLWFDGEHCYFECGVGLGDNNVVPDNQFIIHQFAEKTYAVGYDKNTGSAIEETAYVDFEKFMEAIDAVKNCVSIIPHQIKVDNAYKAAAGNTGGQSFVTNNFNGGYTGDTQQQALVQPMQSMTEYELPLI